MMTILALHLQEPSLHLPLLGLVPVPAIFYILTARFTAPERINSINEIG